MTVSPSLSTPSQAGCYPRHVPVAPAPDLLSARSRRLRSIPCRTSRRNVLHLAPAALFGDIGPGKVSPSLKTETVSSLPLCSSSSSLPFTACASTATSVRVELSTFNLTLGSFSDGNANAKNVVAHGPPAFTTASGRIVAIGDLHGDLQKAIACLELAGVLAEDVDGGIRWTGEDTTVVQLGDVLDRGDCEISTVLLLRELDRQARRHGGAVWMLNGNHESLNVAGDFRYVTPGAFWESAIAAGMAESDIAKNKEGILRARWFMYRPGGQMARELAKNPTVLVVNDVVFAHGGLLPHHVKYGLQRMNDEVAEWMSGRQGTDGSSPVPPFPAMGDGNSVMWNRTFGKERASPYDRIQMKIQLDKTLNELNATAMVIGHTPQMAGINAECDGRVWRADVGMSSGVLNAEAQIVEFSRDSQGRLLARHLRSNPRGGRPIIGKQVIYEGSQNRHRISRRSMDMELQEDRETTARMT